MRKFLQALFAVIAVLVLSAMVSALFVGNADIPGAVLEAKYGQPPSQFITLADGGARVHYRDQGVADGPVLVLLHGSNGALQHWEPWVKALGNEFRIITVDLPGHGLTGAVPGDDYSEAGMVAFVDVFTTALGVQRFALGGNSMGGAVAAHFAIAHPERVTKLILVDAAGFPSKTPQDAGFGPWLAHVPVLQNFLLWITPRSVFDEALQKNFFDQTLVTPEMVDQAWELNLREGTRRITLRRFNLPDDTTIRENAAKITMPTLLIWGDKDRIIPLDAGEAYRDAIKGSQFIVYHDVGHIPMLEVPERSAEAVRFFLEKP
jgi:pimeloyl-ACP methyl ester carboxylesterase